MITVIKFITLIMCFSMYKTMNPVKMSVIILSFSSMIFLTLQEKTQNMWFPTIFFLLFMGGILIMFMILSSLMPNEKSLKLKILYMSPFFMLMMTSMQPENMINSMNLMVKWMLNSNMNMEFLLILMISYFIMFMIMMEKEKIPLRSNSCYYNKIL